MKRADITILGGGISGVTTGVVLQLLGYRTRIYTAERLDMAGDDPAVASHWAAASVIPHSVKIDHVAEHTRRSQRFFEALCQPRHVGSGVRLQRHYEVCETPMPLPPYAGAMQSLQRLPESGEGTPGVPRRREAEAVYGWHFDAYFADLPVYRPRLSALYDAAGGTIIQRRITQKNLTNVPGAAFVNCTGLGALNLFRGEGAPHRLLRGRLVRVEGTPVLTLSKTGEPFSYNYVPGPEVYRMSDGTPGDVYAYPRATDVVLGGTREPGRLVDGSWQSEAAYDGPTRRIDDGDVPTPLFCLNRQLVLDLTGVDLEAYPKRVLTGYRFVRDPVRLEVSEEEGRPVVHNYGHGGAGVALSWSCASEVARLLDEEAGLQPPCALAEAALCTHLRHLAEEVPA